MAGDNILSVALAMLKRYDFVKSQIRRNVYISSGGFRNHGTAEGEGSIINGYLRFVEKIWGRVGAL